MVLSSGSSFLNISVISAILSSFGNLLCFIPSLMQFARSLQIFSTQSLPLLYCSLVATVSWWLFISKYKSWNNPGYISSPWHHARQVLIKPCNHDPEIINQRSPPRWWKVWGDGNLTTTWATLDLHQSCTSLQHFLQ